MEHHPREERASDSFSETTADISWCLQALLELAGYVGGDVSGDMGPL